jgi:Uma2 family endonuclease
MASSSSRSERNDRVPLSYRRSNAKTLRKEKEGRMTTAEYLQTPETVLPAELAYGVLRVAESPSCSHQRLVGELYLAMAPFVRERRLGEVLLAPMDVILDFDGALVVQPDLVYVSNDRPHVVTDRVYGAPDLVVEVLAPHPRIGKLEERIGWFAKYGVRECWLASIPDGQLVVLTLGERGVIERRGCRAGETVPSDLLAGLRLPFIIGW